MSAELLVAPGRSRAVTLIIIALILLLLVFLRAEKTPEPKDVVISPVSLSLYSARHKLQDELILYYLFMDTVTQADATPRQTRWLKGAGQAGRRMQIRKKKAADLFQCSILVLAASLWDKSGAVC